ncbi:MAG: FHA domain-containing protein [Lachnospiraceae bacterium]|nr:FHA domain-containing protein [Lachnospiraceae bacterium]
MRKVSFRVRNFDKEQYLTFNIDNNASLDEELFDFLEDEEPKGIVPIIFEEGEEFDTFSYNITDKIHLIDISNQEITAEMVLRVLHSLVLAFIDMAEYRVPLSYLVLNRNYIYVDSDYHIEFICIPLEDMKEDADVNMFLRNLIASLRFDSTENGDYVARLLSYVNNYAIFNLRNMVTLIEELMDEMNVEIPEGESADIYVDYHDVEEEEEITDSEELEDEAFFEEDLAEPSGLEEYIDDATALDTEEVTYEEEELTLKLDLEEAEEVYSDTTEEDKIQFEEALNAELSESEEPTYEEEELKLNLDLEEAEEVFSGTTEEDKIQFEEALDEEYSELEELSESEEPGVNASVSNTEEFISEENVLKFELGQEEASEVSSDEIQGDKDLYEEEEEIIEELPEEETDEIDLIEIPKDKTEDDMETDEFVLDDIPSADSKQKRSIFKTKEAPSTGIVIEDDFDDFIAEKEREEKKAKDGESGLKIKKNIKFNRASILKNTQEETKPEESEESESAEKKEDTTVLSQKTPPKVNPYLIRVNTEERVVITKQNFKLGKASMGVDYSIKGNSAVSRVHAIIINKDDEYYIQDHKSLNHTYVNGKAVPEGENELLTHDCEIMLGNEEFIFKLS